tara:strand:- start:119 stop:748 length:630 start_codon:yes stop_codon:yes gene_type:complete
MANVNIPDLAALTAPAATDEIEVYDASAAANVRLALSYVALTGTANVFTANQRVNALVGVNIAPTASQQLTVKAGSVSTVGLVVDTPASPTANVQEWRNNGTVMAAIGSGGQFCMESGSSTPGIGASFQLSTVLAAEGQYILTIRLIGGSNILSDSGTYLVGRKGTGSLVDAVLTCTNATVTVNGSYQINVNNSGATNWTYQYALMRVY